MSDDDLSEYEKQRLENIKRNNQMLIDLGIEPISQARTKKAPVRRPRAPPAEPTRHSSRLQVSENASASSTAASATAASAASSSIAPLPIKIKKRKRLNLSDLPSDSLFSGCSMAARQRQGTRRYADIKERIRSRVLSHPDINGELPRPDGVKYKYASFIETPSGWNWRATFGQRDYGSFCEPQMAAFVAWYGKLFRLSKEAVWSTLGLITSEDDIAVRCKGCKDVLTYDTETVVWYIGCSAPGCEVWMCYDCAGFETLQRGEQWGEHNDWYCQAHRTTHVAGSESHRSSIK